MGKTAWEPAPLPKEGTCGSCAHLDRQTALLSCPAQYKCRISGQFCMESDACDQSIEGNADITDQFETLGRNLKLWLEVRGISQRELAERIGVTEVSISRYVNGQRVASSYTLYKISKVLGCTMEDLLRGCSIMGNGSA